MADAFTNLNRKQCDAVTDGTVLQLAHTQQQSGNLCQMLQFFPDLYIRIRATKPNVEQLAILAPTDRFCTRQGPMDSAHVVSPSRNTPARVVGEQSQHWQD